MKIYTRKYYIIIYLVDFLYFIKIIEQYSNDYN